MRPGRPRKLDRKRTVIKSTPPHEITMRRAELSRAGDPVLSESTLGVTYARNLIGKGDYWAGVEYLKRHRAACNTKTIPRAVDTTGRRGGTRAVDEESELAVEQALKFARRALDKAGPAARRITEDVVVFDLWPSWLADGLTRYDMETTDNPDLDNLQSGLHELAKEFGMAGTGTKLGKPNGT